MKYNLDTFTWGMELEFGNVSRNLIPPNSTWNLKEPDIVNILPPYYGIAADPAGINPPVGGELNTIPTTTIKKQVEIVKEILEFFKSNGCEATNSCVSHTHVHVHIPELTKNLLDVKKLLAFAYVHQDNLLEHSFQFDVDGTMSEYALDYYTNDSGRKYAKNDFMRIMRSSNFPEFYSNLIINQSETLRYECPKRYFINFATLQDNETVEFRFFRCTVDIKQIENILNFCYSILDAAFNDKKIDYNIDLPKLTYDHELFTSWEKTKHTIVTTQTKQRKKMLAIM